MKDDKTLRKVLKEKIRLFKNEHPRTVQKEVERIMATKYNVKYGDVVDMFNGISPRSIDEISYEMLYKLMESVHEMALKKFLEFDASDLYAPTYFTPSEIIEFEKPFPEDEKDFDLVITDWKQVTPYKYKIYLTIDELIRWRNYNKLRFNPDTQRDMIVVYTKGVPITKLDINRKSIDSMKKLMSKGLYYNVCGTININPEYNELPKIIGKNLVISAETHMDLIEGFHNYTAETELKDENNNWESEPIEFDLRILTKEEANQFIWQMNEKNHFKAAQATRLDKLNPANYVIDKLNKDTDFYLYGTIDNDMKVFLNKTILHLFKIEDNIENELEYMDLFENNLNIVIRKFKHYDTSFSKEEWFIYLNIIKYCKENTINFKEFIELFDVEKLLNEIKIKNFPLDSHYKTINKKLSEVKIDVL